MDFFKRKVIKKDVKLFAEYLYLAKEPPAEIHHFSQFDFYGRAFVISFKKIFFKYLVMI